MSWIRKIFAAIFIVGTLASIVTISYAMSMYFGAYKVTSLLGVSIQDVKVIPADSVHASVETVFSVENPTEFQLKLIYLKEELYLWNVQNPLGETQKTMYTNPLHLSAFSSVNTTVKINNVPIDQIGTSSPNRWYIRVRLIVDGVPYLGRVFLWRSGVYMGE